MKYLIKFNGMSWQYHVPAADQYSTHFATLRDAVAAIPDEPGNEYFLHAFPRYCLTSTVYDKLARRELEATAERRSDDSLPPPPRATDQ